MADVIEIELEKRTTLGKGVKHLRSEGKIPAVIHNHGQESIIVQGDGVSLLKVYKQAGKHHTVEVKTGGKTFTTLIKDAEFEPRKHRLNHVVFNAVAADQMVEAEVPIEPRYDEGNDASPAERAGLMVLNNLESVTVEALPKDLPDVLYYNAETLVDVGDHVLVSDLIVPSGAKVTDDPSQAIASVFEPSAVAAANDAAGGTAEEEIPAEEEEATEGEQPAEGEEQPAEGDTEAKAEES
ncbi:MAG: 50S ribosomal protein L25 [Candidatus Saccharimonadales bacterium]